MLLNGSATGTGLDPTTSSLPLGLLTRECDPTTFDKIPVSGPAKYKINPKLDTLFQQYAAYLQGFVMSETVNGVPKPRVKLYSDIITRWIAVHVDDGIPLGSTATLLNAFRTKSLSLQDSQFMYVGLYMFVLWFYVVHSANKGHVHDKVKRYVTDQCTTWSQTIGGRSVSIRPEFFLTPQFTDSFDAEKGIMWMLGAQRLGTLAPSPSRKSQFSRRLSEANQLVATLGFITEFRKHLADVVRTEFLDLLSIIDDSGTPKSNMQSNMIEMIQWAKGDAFGATVGLFAISELGTLFWNYELEVKGNSIRPKTKPTKTLALPAGSNSSRSVFLAQWGADQTNRVLVTPRYDSPRTSASPTDDDALIIPLADDVPGPYPNSNGTSGSPRGWSYSDVTGMLSIHDEGISRLDIDVSTGDEMTLLIFVNTLGASTSTTPDMPATTEHRLCFHQTFANNEFVAGPPPWTSATDKAKTREIILRMRDIPASGMKAMVLGGGVGYPTKLPTGFGSAVESDVDQADRNTPDPENESKRYGYGEVSWWPTFGGEKDVLVFVVEGFNSPMRCTWESWQPFDVVTPETDCLTKSDAIFVDIGQHLRRSPRPDGTDAPSYNTVLSAFRAMGMLEAIVMHLQARADELVGTDLTSQQCDEIKQELQGYLQGIFVPIKQYLRKSQTGFQVGYAPPNPLQPAPKTVYFKKYAY